MNRRALLLAAASIMAAAPALADELSERVRGLYRLYAQDSGTPPDVVAVLRRMASRRLAGLLDREIACTRKGEICRLGFDPVVNGQDYRIRHVRTSPAPMRGGRATVVARYTNFGARHEVRYEFVREDGAWKLDDMEARAPAATRWRLTRLLSG